MADLQITDTVLLARILNLGENKQYPAMYQLIADSIKSGAIAVPGGVNSKMYYWYDQAENINADINTSPSTQFIREVAAGGLKYQGLLPINATPDQIKGALDTVSDAIGKGNYNFIKNNKSLPNQTDLVNVDIGQSLTVAGVTPGGWGGSLFFWHEKFFVASERRWTTIGDYILNTPGEREKFVEVTSVALAKVFVDQGLQSGVQAESMDFFKTLMADAIGNKDVVLARLGFEVTNQALLMFQLSKLGFGKPGLAIDPATDSRQIAQNIVLIMPEFFAQLRGAALNEVSQFVRTLSGYLPQDGWIAARALGLFDNEPLALDPATSGSGATTRVDSIWVATDLGNGGRLLKVYPSDPTEVVILSSGIYQQLEIPDGKGGYLQIAMGDKTTDVTSWAGVPGQSVQLKRVLTTQTDTGQNSKTYQGTALVKESTTSEQTINGQASQVIDTAYYDKGQVTSQETVTSTGTMTVTQSYGPKGQLLYRTEVQTYDDGSRFEYKTEGGKNYIQAIDEDGKASGWKEYKTPTQEQATNAMYSDMAGFVNALRGKDKVNQLLYAAKIGINYQISQGNTNPSLQSLHNDVAALGAVVGVVAGLRAMRSGDTKTQIGGAVGLVSSANMLYAYANTGTVAAGGGFLTLEQAGALQLVGAAISISSLKHLDEMIDNGQLDGDGVIGNSREMFNGAATAFDQRGWGSLKYYDSNKDNKIDRSYAVFKLLRMWVDINGDGTAGTMETFTLDMDYVGVDMAKLKASLDAAGQQALAALQQLKVQSIDLTTMKFKLADGSVNDCRSRCSVRALFVKGHNTRWQKNANTSTARLLGCAI